MNIHDDDRSFIVLTETKFSIHVRESKGRSRKQEGEAEERKEEEKQE